MKGYIIKMLTIIFAFTFTNIVWAQTYNSTTTTTGTQPTTSGTQSKTQTMQSTNLNANAQKGMWTCKTNASYAKSGSIEEKADSEMSNNPKKGADAFSFALKHCRDCTKITCTMSR